jgi:DNA-binding XRE family transcriptional regulator/predicted RNase H-like HicB family nuclease
MCVNFEGFVWKEGSFWPIEVPALDIITQGRTKKDAYSMIKEAVEMLVDRKGFAVEVLPMKDDRFILRAKQSEDDIHLTALLLKQQRAKYGLSLSDLADRLGITKHAYAQYEQARSLPSLTKIQDFLTAMNKDAVFAVNVLDSHQAA